MDHIIRVREVISKNPIWIGCLIAILEHLIFNNRCWQELLVFMIAVTMVIEDFRTQLIDMRLFILGSLLLWGMADDRSNFIYLFLWGLLFARLTFLFTTKIKDKIVVFVPEKMPLKIERLPFGYLPSLAISWIIYEFAVKKMDVPSFLLPTHYGMLLVREFMTTGWITTVIVGVCCIVVWVIFEYRLHRAIAENKNIQYGFGDGDVFVLALLFTTLGFEAFMLLFFISLIVQLIFYLFQFLRDEVTFFHYGK